MGIWLAILVLEEVPHCESDRFRLIEKYEIKKFVIRRFQLVIAVEKPVVKRQDEFFVGMGDEIECLSPLFES